MYRPILVLEIRHRFSELLQLGQVLRRLNFTDDDWFVTITLLIRLLTMLDCKNRSRDRNSRNSCGRKIRRTISGALIAATVAVAVTLAVALSSPWRLETGPTVKVRSHQ